jgi:hypothetical protein
MSIFNTPTPRPNPEPPRQTSAATVGLVAACMSQGLLPDETQKVFELLKYQMPRNSAEEIQRQLQQAINQVILEAGKDNPELGDIP